MMTETQTYQPKKRICGSVACLGLVLMVLMACSGHDDGTAAGGTGEPAQGRPISFAGDMREEREVTRSPRGLEEVLTQKTFRVWGYKNMTLDAGAYGGLQEVMSQFTVNWAENSARTTTTNTHDWEYVGQGTGQTIKYWDMTARAYRFFGLAPGADGGMTYLNGSAWSYASTDAAGTLTLSELDCEHPDKMPYVTKLWMGDASRFGQAVTLEFLKPVARVRFLFKYAEDLNIDRSKLSAIWFKPTPPANPDEQKAIAVHGTLTLTYPLTGTATEETWTSAPGSTTIGGNAYIPAFTIDYYEDSDYVPADGQRETYPNSPQHWYYVLPRRNTESFTLSVIVRGGEPKTAEVPREYMQWLPGYQYTYIFKITESGVTLDNFQVGMNTWSVKEMYDHALYNW